MEGLSWGSALSFLGHGVPQIVRLSAPVKYANYDTSFRNRQTADEVSMDGYNVEDGPHPAGL